MTPLLLLLLAPAAAAAAPVGLMAAAPAADVAATVSWTTQSHWDHFAERMVGSGHIGLNSRADYREHLTLAARELGVRYVRGHGMFGEWRRLSPACCLPA
jgi:hypothetical protein